MGELDHWKELEDISLEENSNRYRRVKKALFGDPSGKIKTFAIISPENPKAWENANDTILRKRYNLYKYGEYVDDREHPEILELPEDPKERKEKLAKQEKAKRDFNKNVLGGLRGELLDPRNKNKEELISAYANTDGAKALGYGAHLFVKIRGNYDEYENSLLIFNLALADAKSIARDFGQESFFWGKVSNDENTPSTIGYYETTNHGITYKLKEVSNTIYDETDAESYFSKFGIKFRIGMRQFSDIVPEITDTEEFEESLKEDSTYMSRARHRRRAYEKKGG